MNRLHKVWMNNTEQGSDLIFPALRWICGEECGRRVWSWWDWHHTVVGRGSRGLGLGCMGQHGELVEHDRHHGELEQRGGQEHGELREWHGGPVELRDEQQEHGDHDHDRSPPSMGTDWSEEWWWRHMAREDYWNKQHLTTFPNIFQNLTFAMVFWRQEAASASHDRRYHSGFWPGRSSSPPPAAPRWTCRGCWSCRSRTWQRNYQEQRQSRWWHSWTNPAIMWW